MTPAIRDKFAFQKLGIINPELCSAYLFSIGVPKGLINLFNNLISSLFEKGWKCTLFDSEGKILLFDPQTSYMEFVYNHQINSLLEVMGESISLQKAVKRIINKKE